MASEMNEVMSALHKISTEMSSFTARQEQLEAAQEQSSKQQKESLNELREVLNEVIHEGKRPERDKKASQDEGELYSPSDRPFDFGDLATPSTSNLNTTFWVPLPPLLMPLLRTLDKILLIFQLVVFLLLHPQWYNQFTQL